MKIERIERVLFATGLMLLAVWISARIHGALASRTAITQFEAASELSQSHLASTPRDVLLNSPPDFTLWSVKRIAAYRDSLDKKTDLPLGILRIPKISLEVPVFDGTDDLTLDRGVGRILGTARIGEPSNLGIAGHRDGFFRGLQSVTTRDVVELVRAGATDSYVVREIRIVPPEDVSVLEPTVVPTITLVTCFPFYFVGHAPKRYIVTASLESADEADLGASESLSSSRKNNKIRRR